jgi:hypothetical protein
VIGPVDYADTAAGDRKGWVFDFDISSNQDAQTVLGDGGAVFKLVHPTLGNVLEETDYYFVTNQQAIYAEQFGSGTEFLNQGDIEHATLSVYHRGQELSADSCPPITLWQYRSIPLQAPGNAEPIATDLRPGQPIAVDTRQPGNFLFTFTINDGASPAPALSGDEPDLPAQRRAAGGRTGPGDPAGHRARPLDVDPLHAEDPRHVRQPQKASASLVPEGPDQLTMRSEV